MGVVQEINLINNTNHGSIGLLPTNVVSLDSPFITDTGDMPGTSDVIGKPPKIISFHKQGAATFTSNPNLVPTNLNTNPNGPFVELFNFNPSDYSRIIIDFILCNRSIEANTFFSLGGEHFRAFSSKLISLSYLSSNEPTLINGSINGNSNNNGSTYIEDNNFELQTPFPDSVNWGVGTFCFDYFSPGPGIIPSNIPSNPQMNYDSTNGVTKFGLFVTPNSTIKGIAKLM